MKLFRRSKIAKDSAQPPPLPPEALSAIIPKSRQISLSAEQKNLLEKALDPRVQRILQDIYADRETAERALKNRRVIEFPSGDSGHRRVIQDADGFWRIVPDVPEQQIKCMEGL